jgi:hypothetical protein
MDPSVLSIMNVVNNLIMLVLAIIVLVRLFQRKGVLHGVLGLISLGIYPFIWGWVKNKAEKLTVVMGLWTLTLAVEIVLSVMLTASGAGA